MFLSGLELAMLGRMDNGHTPKTPVRPLDRDGKGQIRLDLELRVGTEIRFRGV
jgi:hypothetical protein